MDKIGTWLALALGYTFGRNSSGAWSGPFNRFSGSGSQYSELRNDYEFTVGQRTAAWFWNCPACGHQGSIFDDDTISEAEEARNVLSDLEQHIVEGGGEVHSPMNKKSSRPHPD